LSNIKKLSIQCAVYTCLAIPFSEASLSCLYRIVNGLLKTALGVPAGSTTTLTVAQDQTFRIESVKCLAIIIRSMSAWMDQQLRISEFSPRSSETQSSMGNHNEEGRGIDYEQQTDTISFDITDSSLVEQRRAYKLELQVWLPTCIMFSPILNFF
jgi:brefeldin A-inhibited guanine nucleotide-exchange protein